jgi:hypothetical protein
MIQCAMKIALYFLMVRVFDELDTQNIMFCSLIENDKKMCLILLLSECFFDSSLNLREKPKLQFLQKTSFFQ